LAHRHDNGADLWATPDGKLAKGGAFSTLSAARLLGELGVGIDDPVLVATTELIWSAWRADGRFRLAPTGAIYPCQTASAAATLAHLGCVADPRMVKTLDHLLAIQSADGGWRCNKFSYGRGPETEFSNPGPTLIALDAFRFSTLANGSAALDRAVDFLLGHWVSRAPLGPCHYGIGSLFLQVGYPMTDYNLFAWVHVLSHYDQAKSDPRFLEALAVLESKLVDGQVVPERVNRALTDFEFCRKGVPSARATLRYQEIRDNLGRGPRATGLAAKVAGAELPIPRQLRLWVVTPPGR
jgi:hypothetical protein